MNFLRDNTVCLAHYGKIDYFPMWKAMCGGHVEIVEIFIGLGADPDQKCSIKNSKYENHTFLQYVANLEVSEYSSINHQIADVLVRHGAEMNASHTPKIGAPLFLAIARGNLHLVELLLKNGAQLGGPHWKSMSPAEIAFHIEDDSICKEMLLLLIKHGLDTKFRNKEGENLLHMFIGATWIYEESEGGDAIPEIAEILLDQGIPIDEPDSDARTPLHRVLSPSRQFFMDFDFELAKLFIKKGANVNLKDEYRDKHPLSLAAIMGDENMIDLLISNGADLHAKDDDYGFTALHIACTGFNYNKKAVELLIRKGADVKIKDRLGRTAFDLLKAMKSGNTLHV